MSDDDRERKRRRLAGEGRAPPRAEEISQRMADVVRTEDGALLLEVDPRWAEAINTVLVSKGVRIDELRKQSMAERLVA